MAQIKSEKAYRAALKRIDELLPVTGDEANSSDPNMLELEMLSDMVYEYEQVHYPIEKPTLAGIVKLRMYEMGITQHALAELLGISSPQMSAIIRGKKDPSLSVARSMSQITYFSRCRAWSVIVWKQ